MNFFGIGTLELLVVLIVALVALGPKRLPQMAQRLGVMIHQARQQVAEARQTIITDLSVIDSSNGDQPRPSRFVDPDVRDEESMSSVIQDLSPPSATWNDKAAFTEEGSSPTGESERSSS